MAIAENVRIKNISYLRARDPSILAWSHHLVKNNLVSEFERTGSSSILSVIPEKAELTKEVQDNHLQVYLRIKECVNFQELYEIIDNSTLLCKVPDGAQCIRNHCDGNKITKKFSFSKIFNPDAKQTDLFNDVVRERVLHFINGFNCSLLTYGASGSGKTFTIVGTADEPGVIPRALEYLFRTLPQLSEQPRIKPTAAGGIIHLNESNCKLERSARQTLLKGSNSASERVQHTRTYKAMQQRLSNEPVAVIMDDISDVSLAIWISFAEIYNEYVYDLLKPAPTRGQQKQKLRLGYCNGNAYIKDLTCISVSSGLEAYQILQYGLNNLKYAATLVNEHSSRSHSIFTIKLAQACSRNEGAGMSLFNFCDLAGSERLKNTNNVGQRLKESNNINTSLLVLGRCISLVRESQKNNDNRLIPFRESKLTQLFQNALLGQEAIAMIVNVNPTREMFDESQHVLNFSAIAKDVIVEEQQLVKRHGKNRFSEYMAARDAELASVSIHNDEDIEDIEALRQQVSELYNELVQQKLDAEEEKEHVANTYKTILDNTNKYWESTCQDLRDLLAKTMRESRKSSLQQAENPPLAIINLDSSSEDQQLNESTTRKSSLQQAENPPLAVVNLDSSSEDQQLYESTSMIRLENELKQAKSQLEAGEIERQKLKAKVKLMEATLKDAQIEYRELELKLTQSKELYSKIIQQQDEIKELTAYIDELHKNKAAECDMDDDKQSYEFIFGAQGNEIQ